MTNFRLPVRTTLEKRTRNRLSKAQFCSGVQASPNTRTLDFLLPEPWRVGRLAGGRFQLRAVLGSGSMGVVFEALDVQLQQLVALKLQPALLTPSSCELEREFEALLRVQHEGVVRPKDLFVEGAAWYFTMELVRGLPFDRWVRPNGVLDLGRLRAAFAQLASVVAALHRAGLLHCDLKPSNVLVTEAGRAVLIDFGLAAELAPLAARDERSEIYGTPAYMAPEQAAGSQPSAASDAYALGVMLYEALTGELPFAGSVSTILWARQRELPARPSALARATPADLEALCLELLAIEPELRPSDDKLLARLACQDHR